VKIKGKEDLLWTTAQKPFSHQVSIHVFTGIENLFAAQISTQTNKTF
jgi:hypothetical protein